MSSTINIAIDSSSEVFTVTSTYTDVGDVGPDPDTAEITVNYFDSASSYPSTPTKVYTVSDTSVSTTTVGSDSVSTFTTEIDFDDIGFSTLIEDGVYSFTVDFTDGGVSLEESNVKTFNDYEVRKKIVFDTIDLGDKLESDNINRRDFYKNEVLQSLLKASNYCASSALLDKALNILDYLKKVTKYW
jgi:hypothetical protein